YARWLKALNWAIPGLVRKRDLDNDAPSRTGLSRNKTSRYGYIKWTTIFYYRIAWQGRFLSYHKLSLWLHLVPKDCTPARRKSRVAYQERYPPLPVHASVNLQSLVDQK